MSDGLPNSSAGPPRMGARWPNLSAGPLRMTDGLPNSSAGLPRMGARWPDLSAGPPEPSVFAESSMVHETGETSGFHELGTLPETSTESTFRTPDGSTTKRPIQISAIGGHPFRQLAYKQKLTIFSTSLYKINQALGVEDQPKEPKKELDLKNYIAVEYHEFLPLFSEALAKNLPTHRPYDHKIPL